MLKASNFRVQDLDNDLPRIVLEGASDAIYTHDLEGQFTSVNPACQELTGYSQAELLGMKLHQIVSPEFYGISDAMLQKRASGIDDNFSYECEVITKAGKRKSVEVNSRPIRYKGEVVLVQGVARDISGRKRIDALQKALYRISYEAYHAEDLDKLYASIHQIVSELMYAKNFYIALLDADTGITSFEYFVDERQERPAPARLTKGLTDHILRTGQPFLARLENLDDLVAMGVIERFGERSIDWLGVPLKKGDFAMGVLAVQTYTEDIRYGEKEKEILTFVSQHIASAIQRKQVEHAMRESESKFRAVAETAATLIYIFDGNGFLYVNHSSEETTGYTRAELLTMDAFSMVHPDFRPTLKQHTAARLLGREAPSRYEFKIITKSGEERWLDLSATVIEFSGKRAILGTAVDTTERKRGELLQSALYRIAEETRLQSDLRQFYSAIHSIVGELMYANNFYIALHDVETNTIRFAYAADEVDTYPPPDEPLPLPPGSLTEHVIRTGEPLFAPLERFKDLVAQGIVRSVGAPSIDWLGVPLKQGDRTFGVLTVQTYNDKIRFNERDAEVLTFVSQHLSTAIEHQRSQEAIRASEERYRTLVQSAVYGIYRSNIDDRFVDVNPALVEMLGYDSADEVLALDMARDIYLDRNDVGLVSDEFERTQRVSNLEVKWKRRNGRPIIVRLSGRAISNPDGKLDGFEMIVEDVTDRRGLEEQLRQSQKMEAVGKLAGGVAHDFNNLLTIIKGNCELLFEESGTESDPELEEIRKAAERAASLTRQLLAFSRQQVLDPKVLDLNSVVGNMNKMLRRLVGEDIELDTRLGQQLSSIKADPGQLEQVVMNLAVNARDAMPTGGKLTIETNNIQIEGAHSLSSDRVKGRYVTLSVSDTGHGMDAATRSRIFEPFFTTKELGKGTGLGLSTVYGIVSQSGGYIDVYSELDGGTKFTIYFPGVDEPAEVTYVNLAKMPAGIGSETILVVEDEDGLRSLIRKVLSKKGYTVLPARDGGEALLLCEKAKKPIDLLLTDVVLPKMGGHQLAHAVLKHSPTTKVLYMSGYTDETIVHHGVLDPDVDFLQKPFTGDALALKVRSVLDAGDASKRANSGGGPRLV